MSRTRSLIGRAVAAAVVALGVPAIASASTTPSVPAPGATTPGVDPAAQESVEAAIDELAAQLEAEGYEREDIDPASRPAPDQEDSDPALEAQCDAPYAGMPATWFEEPAALVDVEFAQTGDNATASSTPDTTSADATGEARGGDRIGLTWITVGEDSIGDLDAIVDWLGDPATAECVKDVYEDALLQIASSDPESTVEAEGDVSAAADDDLGIGDRSASLIMDGQFRVDGEEITLHNEMVAARRGSDFVFALRVAPGETPDAADLAFSSEQPR